ncbi:MAG TPA: LuxR C-terminal-related transcriptional regulator [Vicinamibacterales bacterium]|nr:LuxR C-terminal-related transcriptional regulator [Vicinamibacterales bacterium]
MNRKARRPDPVLIRTKFSRPPSRPEFVERGRLLGRLDNALEQHRLMLVSAPPGFGKTTVVTQWLERQRVPTAWLALDASDRDPERFVRYLVAAIEDGTPLRLPKSTALLAALAPPPFDYLSEVLVSELAAAETRLILVLDDYHTVESHHVHSLVERLVQTMPPTMRVIVVSRVDPPWPLGHWRAQGWLGELRARDLRFSFQEARRFFAGEEGAVLSNGTIEKLHARTEGWIAALRLVQLSLRDSPHPEEQARVFFGSDHFVADYLMQEVLAAQPPEIRTFLTVTAPLSRFSAPLCEHLLNGRAAEPPARETLARVLHLNLFLVPLDADGEWYRYHHLFQDLLLHHLPDLARPERRAEIERAAAEWFAREGFIEEALGHLIKAGAVDAAAELLGANIGAILDADMTRQILQRWLSLFPVGAERGRVPLLVAHTYLRMARWDLRGMGELLDEAAQLLRASAARRTAPVDLRFRADIDALAAFMHYWNGSPTRALEASSRALNALPPRRGGMARWLATRYKAGSLALTGQTREALVLLERAIEDASATGERGIDWLLLTQAVFHWYAVELGAVTLTARRMLALHDAVPTQHYHLGHAHHMLGLVAYAQNRLTAAATEFSQVVAMRYQVNTRTYQDALIGLCLIAKATGDAARVASYAADVRAAALQAGDPVSLGLADWFDVRLTLDAADGPVQVSTPPAADDSMSFWLEVPSVTYAETLLRDRSPAARESALAVIERSLEKVNARHNGFQSIVFSLLRALALADRGAETAALDALAATVRRAEPAGLVRPFIDRGPRLTRLLDALAARDGRHGYLGTLLAAAEGGPATGAAYQGAGPVASSVRLSSRELDVLELLTQRLSNKEIAERLHVSSQTIKKHTRNLYQKLDVHGRREAADKAVAERLIKLRA